MFYHEKYLGLCEPGEAGRVILYPGGRFMTGVPLTEPELEAERVRPRKQSWTRSLTMMAGAAFGFTVAPAVVHPVVGGPLIICLVLYYTACPLRARYRRLRRKYPDRSWTLNTPLRREMAGEVVLPKMGTLILPFCVAGIAFGVLGLVTALDKQLTYTTIGMVASFVFVLTVSAAWLFYHLAFPEREASSR